jgi:hypothetical protein
MARLDTYMSMADPTLKEVLDAIAQVHTDVARALARVEGKVDAVDAKVGVLDAQVNALGARVDAHRAETAKGFAELERSGCKPSKVAPSKVNS